MKSLQQGKEVAGIEWIPEVTVDRKNAQGLTDLAMNQAFNTNTIKLPAYSGMADAKQGYLLVKVVKVNTIIPTAAEAQKTSRTELNAALASEYLAAYKQSLREKAKVKVNEKILLANQAN